MQNSYGMYIFGDKIMGKNVKIPIIDWRITSVCNNSCKFCYASEQIEELTRSDTFLLIKNIVKSGCKKICISGGEPLLRSRTLEVIKELYNNNISIYLSTNGTNYINQRELIEPYIEKLALPLDGFDEISNVISGRKINGFNVILEILQLYKREEHRFIIQIGTVLTKQNLRKEHFANMYNILKDYPIDIWKIYEFIPEGRGIKYQKELQITTEERFGFLKDINDILNGNIMNIIFAERRKRDSAYFIIRPDGKVIIPVDGENVEEKLIGNALTDRFEDILENWEKLIIVENVEDTTCKRNIEKSMEKLR